GQLKTVPSIVQPIRTSIVTLPAGRAGKLVYAIRMPVAGLGTITITAIQFVLIKSGSMYVVTFGTTAPLKTHEAALTGIAKTREPIVVVGCGTSEHGAQGFVEIVRDGLGESGPEGSIVAAQAFEAALEPQGGGLLIGISHEGATWATSKAMTRAQEAGAQIAIVTVSDRSPGAAAADLVVATDELDQSWCHTIGYLSPLVVATAIAGHLSGKPAQPGAAREILGAGLRQEEAAEDAARKLARARHIMIVASGAD